MSGEILYDDGEVSVTPSQFKVGSTVYAIRNITSVRIETEETPPRGSRGCMWLVLVFTVLFVGTAASIVLEQGLRNLVENVIGNLIGVVFLLALAAGLKPRPGKVRYSIVLASSAGEKQGLCSEDPQFIDAVMEAIQEAISLH